MKIVKILKQEQLDELCLIDKESFSSSWDKKIYSKMLQTDLYEIYGVYFTEQLVAFICLSDTTDVIEILRVAVLTAYRKQGIAEKLLNYISENSKREELFLEVRSGNKAALNLYKKIGFEEIGIRKNYYKDTNENALVMKKELNKK